MVMLQKVMSGSSGEWITCVWCRLQGEDRPGYELFKSVFHEHAREIPCDDPRAAHINFVFCSELHKQYYRNSHIDMGNLPPGFRSSF